MDGVPAGDDPLPHDIGYYAPSGDLVFYYDDVGYFTGIVRLGQFDGSMDAIVSQTGVFTARIERANRSAPRDATHSSAAAPLRRLHADK